MRVLIATGGSGGHLAPAVAVWRALREADASAEALFLCTHKPADAEFLAAEGAPYRPIPSPSRSLRLPLDLLAAVRASAAALREFRPDIVFGKGGAVSIVPCLLARLRGVPVVIHESDAVMGRANRFLARFANRVCAGLPCKGSTDVTGNPVRPEVTRGDRAAGLALTGLSGKKPVLLVLGGSQGALELNRIVALLLPGLLASWDVVHVTGKGKATAAKSPGYMPIEFAGRELPHLYAIATAAVSRAGAGSIAELQANGIPAILVPLTEVAQDHQSKNAEAAAAGGSIVVQQERLADELIPLLGRLLEEPGKLAAMRRRTLESACPQAASQIVKILAGCVARAGRNP